LTGRKKLDAKIGSTAKNTNAFIERISAQCAAFREFLEANRENAEAFDPRFTTCPQTERKAYAEELVFRILCLYFIDAQGWFDAQNNGSADTNRSSKGTRWVKRLFDKAAKADVDFVGAVFEPVWSAMTDKQRGFAAYDADIQGLRHLRIPRLGGDPIGARAFIPQKAAFPRALFEALFNELDAFNFVWNERNACNGNAVTPEIFGALYEKLLEAHDVLGAYYTPKEVAAYMAKESLAAYLASQTGIPRESAALFINSHDASTLSQCGTTCDKAAEVLRGVRICDPAVGAGAFPLALLNELTDCLMAIEPDTNTTKLQKFIVEHCLWGADIDAHALHVARLRLWFALTVNANSPNDIEAFEFHFTVGDSLGPTLLPKLAKTAGGFDIVIGNPPYGVKMGDEDKQAYKKRFAWLEKRFDIYMAFYSMGFALTKNVLCYIAPDKWLSKSFALKFREHCMVPNMKRVLHLKNAVFDTATVDAIVTVFEKTPNRQLEILGYEGNVLRVIQTVDKTTLETPFLIDQYFRKPSRIIEQLENQPCKLADFAKCDYACVSPVDAYKLKGLLRSCSRPKADDLVVINTGLIGKYLSHWNDKEMRYLKSTFSHPVVAVASLEDYFGAAYVQRMRSPKLIIKGLNLLDCTIDTTGNMMSTAATLNVRASSPEMLLVLGAIINSSLMSAYCKAKYVSSSYCGGLEFTPGMINQLPVPDLSNLDDSRFTPLLNAVRATLSKRNKTPLDERIRQIDALVCELYSVTSDILDDCDEA